MSETKWTPREQVIVEFARWISDWASITHRKGVQERVREFVAELEAVPASDPRALALEEAARHVASGRCTWGGNATATDCLDAGREKPCWRCRAVRALSTSGSESPRAEGAGRPLEHLAALRLDATAVPSSAVLPLSGVPIGTVLLALIEEVEASRRAGLPVETAGSESPRDQGAPAPCPHCDSGETYRSGASAFSPGAEVWGCRSCGKRHLRPGAGRPVETGSEGARTCDDCAHRGCSPVCSDGAPGASCVTPQFFSPREG